MNVNGVDLLDYSFFFLVLIILRVENMLDIVEFLCEFGVNVNYSSGVFFGEIFFYFVVMYNNYVFIELLVCFNVNVYV